MKAASRPFFLSFKFLQPVDSSCSTSKQEKGIIQQQKEQKTPELEEHGRDQKKPGSLLRLTSLIVFHPFLLLFSIKSQSVYLLFSSVFCSPLELSRPTAGVLSQLNCSAVDCCGMVVYRHLKKKINHRKNPHTPIWSQSLK